MLTVTFWRFIWVQSVSKAGGALVSWKLPGNFCDLLRLTGAQYSSKILTTVQKCPLNGTYWLSLGLGKYSPRLSGTHNGRGQSLITEKLWVHKCSQAISVIQWGSSGLITVQKDFQGFKSAYSLSTLEFTGSIWLNKTSWDLGSLGILLIELRLTRAHSRSQ